MVRNALALRRRQFPGAYVEAAIQLHGIVVYHLSVQPLSQHQGQRRLAGSGGADDRNQGMAKIRRHTRAFFNCGMECHRRILAQPDNLFGYLVPAPGVEPGPCSDLGENVCH